MRVTQNLYCEFKSVSKAVVVIFGLVIVSGAFTSISSASTDELYGAHFLLNDYIGSNATNSPYSIDPTCSGVGGATGPCVTNTVFSGPDTLFTYPTFDEMTDGKWNFYTMYYNEHSGEGFPMIYALDGIGGGFGELSKTDMTSHHPVESIGWDLFLTMTSAADLADALGVGGSDELVELGTYSTGCPNFCRAPVGFVWSPFNAANFMSSITTYSEAYAFMESLINTAATATPVFNITDDVTSTTTWGGGVYKVTGNIEIVSGVTLTIEEGTVVKFDTATSSGLIVNGTLDAVGDVNSSSTFKRIFLTSLLDDAVPPKGDSNNDATSTSPSAGDWGAINIGSGGSANFEFVTVRYGGGVGAEALVHNNGGSFEALNSTFAYSTTSGIKNSSGTTTILTADVGFNNYGFYLSGGSLSITASSTIHDNVQYGIYNSTTNLLNAENNWWIATSGVATSGPLHSVTNAIGTGDRVSDYVDYYPWIGIVGEGVHYLYSGSNQGCPLGCGMANASGTLVWRWASTTSSTTISNYDDEAGDAVETWEQVSATSTTLIMSTSTVAEPVVDLIEVSRGDVPWNGLFNLDIFLNTYFLNDNTSVQVQRTITHELGHAFGLDHSYTGNVMYHNQTSDTHLGPQDLFDYHYLWD